MEPVIFPGEDAAVQAALAAGAKYGYGNLIAHLKRAWAMKLMQEYAFPETDALKAADTTAYPIGKQFKRNTGASG